MSYSKNEQMTMFDKKDKRKDRPVTCLGKTFNCHEDRRAYFTEELRKKLPELKKMEGFPIGEDDDILALSDPPYFTACPNPWINDFIKLWESEKQSKFPQDMEEYHREPFAADVSEGKTDSVYKTHSYHTKVPHKAIMRYILHYTNPGDVILDGFSGTGMTGVASQLCGDKKEVLELGYTITDEDYIVNNEGSIVSKFGERKSILSDLSPAAYFISKNFNSPVDEKSLEDEFNKVFSELEAKCSWLYQTNIGNDSSGKINFTVWSDVFHCPNCNNEVVFWDIAVDEETETLNKQFKCNHCDGILTKKSLERAWESIFDPLQNKVSDQAKQRMVSINYKYGTGRYNKKPTNEDSELLKHIEEHKLSTWFPNEELPHGYNTSQPIRSHGIHRTYQFYTKRSLIVLSTFYDLIQKSELKDSLMLMLTGIAYSTTKLYRWTPNYEGGGPLSGTYYIPAIIREISAIEALKRFGRKIPGNLAFSKELGNVMGSIKSATSLNIDSEAIDYIFVDPPFGGNIMYSELNFLWESWLKVRTNNFSEAIVNDQHNKAIQDYQSLLCDCFSEYYRVLKPGKWMTVEFSNSQSTIWNVIQEAIQRAGFVIANVSTLDKKQGSFKALTTTTAVKQDLVISAYKPKSENVSKMKEEQNTERSAWTFVQQHLEQLPVFIGNKGIAQPIIERTPRILFDRMVAYHVQNGLPVPISSAEFQEGISQRFPMRDGMAFLENQIAEYDKKRILVKEFSQMSLFVSDENSAIEWMRQQLMNKPQTRQDLHPNYMKEIQHISKHELLPELDQLLEQNFLMYEGVESVPNQIHTYLSTNYKDLRGLDKGDQRLKDKAKNRWYVPDPNKQADLEKLREKSLLREFANYKEELDTTKKKLKQFRTEAIRAGFKKAWGEKDYNTIVKVGERLPESVIQEDDKLLMYFDNAQIRLGM